jgi:hypothetical protein
MEIRGMHGSGEFSHTIKKVSLSGLFVVLV